MCSDDASEVNLTQCSLLDACTNICNSSTIGIHCYGGKSLYSGVKGLKDRLLLCFVFAFLYA